MNQADVSKLMSQLKFAVMPSHRRLRCPEGPEGRMLKLRKTVTALFKNERIELYSNRADEARGYAEQVRVKMNRVFFKRLKFPSGYSSSMKPSDMETATRRQWN